MFFEQAEWLWATVLHASRALSFDVHTEVRNALRRTYTVAAIRPVTVRRGPNSFVYRPAGTVDYERRLLSLTEPARGNSDFDDWWREAFAARVVAWASGKGEPESIFKLLESIDSSADVDLFGACIAAKKALQGSDVGYVQGLEWLYQLRRQSPEAFSHDEWEDHVVDFEMWLRDDLASSAEDMSDSSELQFVDRVADLLGVTIDEDVWVEASETVDHNERERDSQIDPDDDYPRDSVGELDRAAEEREIAAIFARLVD